MRRSFLGSSAVSLAMVFAASGPAHAVDWDNMTLVVDTVKATNGASIAAYGYDPVNDIAYAAGFTGGAQIRRITNVSDPLSQASTVFVNTNDWLMFLKDGHTDWASGTPTIGSLILNPLPIYDEQGAMLYPAYSRAFITDQVSALREGTSTYHYEMTQRVYAYNLQAVQTPPDPVPPPPPYYDGRDVFTSYVTLQEMADAIGVTPPGTSNIQKQIAFSGDGQFIYFNESGPTYGGIWRCLARDGSGLVRIYAAVGSSTTDRIYTDPGVVHTSVRDLDPANPKAGDQILVRGTNAHNLGGLDYILDTGGSTAEGPYTALTANQLKAFLEITSDPDVEAVAVDEAGNIYVDDATTKALLRFDPLGRLAAIKNRLQHIAFNKANSSTSTNAATQLMQLRTVQAPSGTFDVVQILYRSVALKGIGGIYCYKPADLDRDNAVGPTDVALFNSMYALGTTAPSETDPNYQSYIRCDLNGNGSVSSKDLEILKQFLRGDMDVDGDVDVNDFAIFQACFNGPNNPAAQPGCERLDFDADGDVDVSDFAVFQVCFNGANQPIGCE